MKTKKRFKFTAIFLVIILAITLLATTGFTLSAKAAFLGLSPEMSLSQLLSASNTFNNTYVSESNYNVIYNMDVRNNNQVMPGSPQITVLTHGLAETGEGASHWSNTYPYVDSGGKVNFCYDEASLIHKLNLKAGGANIYWAKMQDNKKDFVLYDLVNGSNISLWKTNYKDYMIYLQQVPKITDIYKHTIIVFESSNGEASNNTVYCEFNNMLSKVIYDIKMLNPGQKLPRVNLIGHSRGGITNLQYALDHPDLVASMISIGTPFFSSWMAKYIGTIFMDSDGLQDCVNESVYNGYYARWQNKYHLYSRINARAVVGNTSADFLMYSLSPSELAALLGVSLVVLVAGLVAGGALYTALSAMAVNTDVLVPTESQSGRSDGKNYNFITYSKTFKISTTDLNKRNVNNFAVPHNLETRDAEIINYIVNSITVSTPMIWGINDIYSYNSSTGRYDISTANQLDYLRYLGSNVTGLKFNITNVIDLSSYPDWKPIPEFRNTLYGNYNWVTNLRISTTYSGSFGLFGTNYGTIDKVTVAGSIVVNNSYDDWIRAGFIAGTNHGTIAYCTAYTGNNNPSVYHLGGTFDAEYHMSGFDMISNKNWSTIGGIAGYNGGGIIINSTNYATICGRGDIGGIVGTSNGIISNCTNHGNISYVYSDPNRSVGGIVGYQDGSAVSYCNNYGNIKYENVSSSSASLYPAIAQIIGRSTGITCTSCYCNGSVNKGNLTSNQARYVSSGDIGALE